MQQQKRNERRGRAIAAACLCALSSARAAGAEPVSVSKRLAASALVRHAAKRAASKLDRPHCREVLADFRDESGRTLERILEERGLSATEFLASLKYLDGRNVPQCATGRVAAGAAIGSPYIAICKETFARLEANDQGLAANTLIHEMLHALGLPEAPLWPDAPSSEEITRQVARRCGR